MTKVNSIVTAVPTAIGCLQASSYSLDDITLTIGIVVTVVSVVTAI